MTRQLARGPALRAASTTPAAALPPPGAPLLGPTTSPAVCVTHSGWTPDDSAGKRQGGSAKACRSRLPHPCPQHAGKAKAHPEPRVALSGPSHSESETQAHQS